MTLKRALTLLAISAGVWLSLFGARRLLRVSHGLRAEYFSSTAPGSAVALSAVDPEVSLNQIRRRWNAPLPPELKVRWFGYLNVRTSGAYSFATTSDDGSTLSIDGRLIVDNGGRHATATRSATVDLTPGPHTVFIEYVQFGGDAALDWTWARGSAEPVPVPGWVLSPSREPFWKIAAARSIDVLLAAAAVAIAVLATWTLVGCGTVPLWQWSRAHPNAPVFVLFVALAIVETWPLASDPAHLSRNDNGDTMLNEWAIAWIAHAAPFDLRHVFDGNAFYPERHTLAFSETMPLQGAMAAPILWTGGSPVLAYNLVLLAGFALTGWTMQIVTTRWTANRLAGVLAGVLFAFNAHSLTRIPHLQAQHVEFLPLAVFALDRLFFEPTARHAWRLAGWFVLQALTSVYLLVLTAASLVAATIVRPDAWLGRRRLPLVGWSIAAAAAAAALLLPFLLPYWQLYHEQGLTRSIEEAARFSAVWRQYLSTPSRLHYRWWSYRWFAGSALFPGVVALALTSVAIGSGVAFRDRRARMCLMIGIAGIVLSFGTKVPGFSMLYEHVPLLHSVRVVSRFGFLAIFAAASLAAFGAAHLASLLPSRMRGRAGVAVVVLAAIELFPGPLELVRFEGIPRIYASLRDAHDAIVVEMPFYGGATAFVQARYMLNSTAHWRPILNGYTGLPVRSYERNIARLASFPDASSVAWLQAQAVTHVFVHTDELDAGRSAALDAMPQLHRVASEGPLVLFRLDPARMSASQ